MSYDKLTKLFILDSSETRACFSLSLSLSPSLTANPPVTLLPLKPLEGRDFFKRGADKLSETLSNEKVQAAASPLPPHQAAMAAICFWHRQLRRAPRPHQAAAETTFTAL